MPMSEAEARSQSTPDAKPVYPHEFASVPYRIETPTGRLLLSYLADFDLTKDSPEPWKSRPRIAAAPFIAAIEQEARLSLAATKPDPAPSGEQR